MSRLPEFAILDGRRKVTVLQSPKKNYFDILVVRKGGKERTMFVHRSRLRFLPTVQRGDARCGVVLPPKEDPTSPEFLQDELPLG